MRKVWGTGLAAVVTRNQRLLRVDGKTAEVSFGLDAIIIGCPRLVECNRGTKNSIPITGAV